MAGLMRHPAILLRSGGHIRGLVEGVCGDAAIGSPQGYQTISITSCRGTSPPWPELLSMSRTCAMIPCDLLQANSVSELREAKAGVKCARAVCVRVSGGLPLLIAHESSHR